MSKRNYRLEDGRKKTGVFGLLFLMILGISKFLYKLGFNKALMLVYKKVIVFIIVGISIITIISMFNNDIEPTLEKKTVSIPVPNQNK